MRNKGFTLVEISIVLMVIGLIVAGVLTGKDLLYNASINKVIKELNEFVALTQLFKSKYDAYPGDMPNATTYWSTAQNGNGDSAISCRAGPPLGSLEEANFWSHLNLSGFYINRQAPMSVWSTANFYMPKSSWPESGWMLCYYGAAPVGPRNTFAMIKWAQYDSSATLYSSNLTPLDVYNIDIKIDDGKPSTGNIQRDPYNEPAGCISGSDYNVSNTAKVCVMHTLFLN